MKSSIHIVPVKSTSEAHNTRAKDLDYVRRDLLLKNESWSSAAVPEVLDQASARYHKKVGQKMQAKTSPVREAVFLFEERHTMGDIKNLSSKIEARFGLRIFQIHMHRDEGRWVDSNNDKIETDTPSIKPKNAEAWLPNFHGHLLIDWMDHGTGKSIKLNRDDMAELQTLVAVELGMERGASSDKKHLTSQQFKSQEAINLIRQKETAANKALRATIDSLEGIHTSAGEIVAYKTNLIGKTIDVEATTDNAKAILAKIQKIQNELAHEKQQAVGRELHRIQSLQQLEKLKKEKLATDQHLKSLLQLAAAEKKIDPVKAQESLNQFFSQLPKKTKVDPTKNRGMST